MRKKSSKDWKNAEAISYWRFSSKPQEKGDSFRRQGAAFDRVCQRYNLRPSSRWSFRDEGRSGYHGRHISKGDFGKFLALVESGEIPAGSVLVIEAWDRYGRMEPMDAVDVLKRIIRAGIAIAVDNPDAFITQENINDPQIWLIINFALCNAHSKSKQLAEYKVSSWEAKRETGFLTSICPWWLAANQSQTGFVVAHLDEVKRMIELSIDNGQATVSKMMNQEFPWRTWHASLVQSTVRSIWLKGEMQPRDDQGNPQGKVKTGYYPAVLTETEWDTLQNKIDARTNQRGPHGKKMTNLFTSLCTDDHGQLLHLRMGHGGRHYLVTARSRDKAIARISVRYDRLERAVLRFLTELDPASLLPKQIGSENERDVLEGQLAGIERRQGDIKRKMANPDYADLDALVDASASLKVQHQDIQTRLDAVKREATCQAQDMLAQIQDAIDTAQGDVDGRSRLRSLIAQLIKNISLTVNGDVTDAVIVLRDGVQRGIWFTKDEMGLFMTPDFLAGKAKMTLADMITIRRNQPQPA